MTEIEYTFAGFTTVMDVSNYMLPEYLESLRERGCEIVRVGIF